MSGPLQGTSTWSSRCQWCNHPATPMESTLVYATTLYRTVLWRCPGWTAVLYCTQHAQRALCWPREAFKKFCQMNTAMEFRTFLEIQGMTDSTVAINMIRPRRSGRTRCWRCGDTVVCATRHILINKWRHWQTDSIMFMTSFSTLYFTNLRTQITLPHKSDDEFFQVLYQDFMWNQCSVRNMRRR